MTAVPVLARPGKDEVDPLLGEAERLVVVGDDADLAAVLTRLLRTERLDVELAHVSPQPSAATRCWGLPAGAAAAALALTGTARPRPLARDDAGIALVGRASITGPDGERLTGETYADNTRVFTGTSAGLWIEPSGDEPGLRVAEQRRWRPRWVTGRAVQTGSTGLVLTRDGVQHERVLKRSTFYRHTTDWLLVG
ncbi:hypothetical protein [Rhodococcus sp. X156]|uniref:hypothetical protein n=1 Tax=Rhodococcus sp. X156 TaxID=2499145 RepID=UPI001F495ECF|nr:hypothetical protein [Rhodococcus sp. X156]